MPRIYDNIELKLHNGLNNTLEVSNRADFCIGYFNLRGWAILCDHIERLNGGYLPVEYSDEERYYCRLLIGMQRLPEEELKDFLYDKDPDSIDNAEALRLKKKVAEDFKKQLQIGSPTNEGERTLRRLAHQLREGRVRVKLHLRYTLHAKLYLAFREDVNNPITGFVGSSNLTLSGISSQGELNVDVVEEDAALKLAKWFQDRWQDRWSIDITEILAEIIGESWAREALVSPYHVYLKMAYHLSREARAGITEFQVPAIFKNKLLVYQERAVQIAARHLHKRGGVIIGDVVGLGKTYTATALAKMFEDDFFLETLIICPKNLKEMWESYAHNYQLRAKVISITQVQNALASERRYRLVIIDESHNLRNREGKRYRAIQEYLYQNESKVILLTATPYNKSYLDLSNQLRLFLDEGYNLGIRPERYIDALGGSIQFNARHQVGESTIGAFEHSQNPEDWAELMRQFLVRRTRSFIKDNYGKIDKQSGRRYLEFPNGSKSFFPERIPKKVEYAFDPNDPSDQYAKLYSSTVVDTIDKLILPRYGLGQTGYENPDAQSSASLEEQIIRDNLSRAGTRLIGFARTNLFKRLESSGFSFLQSVSRHILRNYLFLHAIETGKPFPVGNQEAGMIDEFMQSDRDENDDPNVDEDDMATFLTSEKEYKAQAARYYFALEQKKKRFQWISSWLFNEQLKQDLIHDSEALFQIIEMGKSWDPEKDRQLNALHELISKKHKNEKVLVFTQYSDTANYLFGNLKKRGVKRMACVTGDTDNPTHLAQRFSPVSNDKFDIPESQHLRVLISTDVLSEGQNLQDAHIVLNYDLPWAIIRLIQRAGRVDRIGQESDKIYCYSFLPEKGIEKIIQLRRRLKQRIKENAETVGSDEVFFEGDPINIQDLYNEKSGILDEDEDIEIDLASQAFQIWQNAIEADPELEKVIPELPNVIYATKKAAEGQVLNGSIVYTKTSNENDMLAWVDANRNIVTQSQSAILKAARCRPDEQALPRFDQHHELVKVGLEHITETEAQVGGQLGTKRSARFRVYQRLDTYLNQVSGTLFDTEDLRRAFQDIYDYPLLGYARDTINRHLKSGISNEDLANLVVSLRENEKLSLISRTEEKQKEPMIICSMGLSV